MSLDINFKNTLTRLVSKYHLSIWLIDILGREYYEFYPSKKNFVSINQYDINNANQEKMELLCRSTAILIFENHKYILLFKENRFLRYDDKKELFNILEAK